jgi:hypothetical protein
MAGSLSGQRPRLPAVEAHFGGHRGAPINFPAAVERRLTEDESGHHGCTGAALYFSTTKLEPNALPCAEEM